MKSKTFIDLNRESIFENKEIGNGLNGETEYKSLKDHFIDFIYNNYDYFELVDDYMWPFSLVWVLSMVTSSTMMYGI